MADPQHDRSGGTRRGPDADRSTAGADLPTTGGMAAPHHLSDDDASGGARRRNWLLGLTTAAPGTPKGVPDVTTLTEEIDDLRARLATAERRARDAETALPHLLGLGQNTVNGLLDDARARGRQIIDGARTQAEAELAAERAAVRQEARDLEALRMAVAAEAMGLEEIRAELQRRISLSAAEIARVAAHPRLLGQPLPLAEHGIAPVPAVALAPAGSTPVSPPAELRELFAPDLDGGIGLVEASTAAAEEVEAQLAIAHAVETTGVEATTVEATPRASEVDDQAPTAAVEGDPAPPTDAATGRPASNPSAGFADAWAEDEDEAVAEAFDRFFSAEVGTEPSRDWILADDTKP